MSKEFGSLIKLTRTKKYLSRRDLSEIAKTISWEDLGLLEKGKLTPRKDQVEDLMRVLEFTEHEIELMCKELCV